MAKAREDFDDKLLTTWKKTLTDAFGPIDPTDAAELLRLCKLHHKINLVNSRLANNEIVVNKVNPLLLVLEKYERLFDTMSRRLGLHMAHRISAQQKKATIRDDHDDDEDDDGDDAASGVALP
jgi:phage terminase small subunit